MWTYGITYNVPIKYKYNTNKVFQSASKAEDVFRVLLVLKLVLQLGSSVALLVQEPLAFNEECGLNSERTSLSITLEAHARWVSLANGRYQKRIKGETFRDYGDSQP
ncbi:hypothetical protein Tco_0873132 [Tanacetum coccineum]